jgi:muramoyltetrapeptide carboxypeptidase
MCKIIYPERLKKGDKIAIISPASVVKPEYIDGAAELLRRNGLVPVIMPHAKGPAAGSYASSVEHRVADFRQAWSDPEVKALLCARGGYGCVHLLPHLDAEFLRTSPKWLIGFSDVSALHAMLLNAGIASIHGPMAKHLTVEGDDHYCTRDLLQILLNEPKHEYHAEPSTLNVCGAADGRLIGGNLAVLNGLAATPYDEFAHAHSEKCILFIEDISEPIYAVERMLHRLALSGTLGAVEGLVVGKFTEYKPDKNFENMESMIDSLLRSLPKEQRPKVVAYNFPVGHVSDNRPLIVGAHTELRVTPGDTMLAQLKIEN